MNRIFTLCLLGASAFGMQAAEFELYFDGTPVTNDATYVSGYEMEVITITNPSTGVDEERDFYKQDSRLSMKGPAGSAVSVAVSSNNTSVQVCSVDGNCDILSAANGYSLTKSGYFTGALEDLRIDKEYTKKTGVDPKMKDIVVEVTVTSGSDSKHVTVNMSNTINGVESVSVDKGEYVKVAGRTLSYSVNGSTELAIYSITGVRVLSTHISGHGSLSLSSLPKGIYLYRAGRSNGKILVR